ncbi:hypothetical protein [Skermanella stibiiresistens]|uniref:hypothetical protein n=1 Tax=Skermanella stibiiresistens TaxID=913326 RepID=UPI0012F7B318|nr:hypothetical protein [Skermanella stibiiresistens]
MMAMNRSGLRKIGLAAALALVWLGAVTASGHADDRGVNPIWISPVLELEPDRPLSAVLDAPWEDAFDVIIDLGAGQTRDTIRTCADYIRLGPAVVGAGSDQEYRVLRSTGTRCAALDLIGRAKPAERSFVKDFRFDKVAAHDLPPALALAVSPDEERRVKRAAAAGGSILDVDRSITLHGLDTGSAELRAKDWKARLAVLARGDFDGDGIEDMLVRRDASKTGGTYASSDLFVLTRTTPSKRLHIITPAR